MGCENNGNGYEVESIVNEDQELMISCDDDGGGEEGN
ncbi:hypothetical protein C5167_026340 [Papaver somniferum]|nr:hypothetical protein C5167_026340 [Papaver somniferum]